MSFETSSKRNPPDETPGGLKDEVEKMKKTLVGEIYVLVGVSKMGSTQLGVIPLPLLPYHMLTSLSNRPKVDLATQYKQYHSSL
jgi:hypothetical protein